MDTEGMPVEEPEAIRWKDRVLATEPGLRSSMKAQVMDILIPDVTLLVFDAEDLYTKIGKINPSATDFLKQYRPLIDEIRSVIPNHPFLVVLTKVDKLDEFMDTQDGTLEDAKTMLEKEVAAVFDDAASSVKFVTNYTIPTKDEKEKFEALASAATEKGQSREKYAAQIDQWTQQNQEHLDLLFVATNVALKASIKEKRDASIDKTCMVM